MEKVSDVSRDTQTIKSSAVIHQAYSVLICVIKEIYGCHSPSALPRSELMAVLMHRPLSSSLCVHILSSCFTLWITTAIINIICLMSSCPFLFSGHEAVKYLCNCTMDIVYFINPLQLFILSLCLYNVFMELLIWKLWKIHNQALMCPLLLRWGNKTTHTVSLSQNYKICPNTVISSGCVTEKRWANDAGSVCFLQACLLMATVEQMGQQGELDMWMNECTIVK